MIELALVTLIVLAGSACQAAIGMGLNLLAIPLLVLINPLYAPGPVMVVSALLSVAALWRVPARIEWGELKLGLIGLVIGTVIAAIVIATIDTSELSRILGALVVAAVLLALSGLSLALTRPNLLAAGTGAGFLGTIAGVHAPPIALIYQSQSPDRIRGGILPYLALGNAMAVAALASVGHFGLGHVQAAALLGPGTIAGLFVAPALARTLSPLVIRRSVLAISAASGLSLVFR